MVWKVYIMHATSQIVYNLLIDIYTLIEWDFYWFYHRVQMIKFNIIVFFYKDNTDNTI